LKLKNFTYAVDSSLLTGEMMMSTARKIMCLDTPRRIATASAAVCGALFCGVGSGNGARFFTSKSLGDAAFGGIVAGLCDQYLRLCRDVQLKCTANLGGSLRINRIIYSEFIKM
jgi:hypothetical protein